MFIRQSAYKGHNSTEVSNKLKSETVPDKSLTIQQMLTKSIQGALPPIQHAASFSGDYIPPINADYSDLHAILDANKSKIRSIREKQQIEAQEQIKAAREAERLQIIAAYEAQKKE